VSLSNGQKGEKKNIKQAGSANLGGNWVKKEEVRRMAPIRVNTHRKGKDNRPSLEGGTDPSDQGPIWTKCVVRGHNIGLARSEN